MSGHSRIGRCLCGKVELSFKTATNKVEACHCSMCRTWGGGPLLSFEPSKEPTIKGEEFVTTYSSSEWAERAFCNSCGSHLFYKLVDTGDYMIPPGLLSSSEELELSLEVFIDEKPEFYSFSQQSEKLTGEEVIQRFQAQLANSKPS